MKLVIVEDHLMFRDVIRKVATRQGHRVLGETHSGEQAIALIGAMRPDLVILDLSPADLDGFTAMERARQAHPGVRFLIVSAHCEEYVVARVEEARPAGFIDKASNAVDAIREALREIEAGRCFFSPAYQCVRLARIMNQRSVLKTLSNQEQTVLGLVGHALNDREIGRRLRISHRTAEGHRQQVGRKLGVRSTLKLVQFAIREGFAEFPR